MKPSNLYDALYRLELLVAGRIEDCLSVPLEQGTDEHAQAAIALAKTKTRDSEWLEAEQRVVNEFLSLQ